MMTSMREQTLGLRKKCPEDAQSLFFSATFPETVAKFAESIVREPYTSVRLKPEEVTVEEIFQFWIKCVDDKNKFHVLDTLYGVLTIGQSIIFVHRVESAKWLAKEMEKVSGTLLGSSQMLNFSPFSRLATRFLCFMVRI